MSTIKTAYNAFEHLLDILHLIKKCSLQRSRKLVMYVYEANTAVTKILKH
jgi:hypothetical protein